MMRLLSILFENKQHTSHFVIYRTKGGSAIRLLKDLNVDIDRAISSEEPFYQLGIRYDKWMADNIHEIKNTCRQIQQIIPRNSNAVESLVKITNIKLSAFNSIGAKRNKSKILSKSSQMLDVMELMVDSFTALKKSNAVPVDLRDGFGLMADRLQTELKQHAALKAEHSRLMRSQKENESKPNPGAMRDKQRRKEQKNVTGAQNKTANDLVAGIISSLPVSDRERADIRRVVSRSGNQLATLTQEISARNIEVPK